MRGQGIQIWESWVCGKKKKKVGEIILEKVQNKKRPGNGFLRKHGYLKDEERQRKQLSRRKKCQKNLCAVL